MIQLDGLGRTFRLLFGCLLDTSKPVEALAVLVGHGFERFFLVFFVNVATGWAEEVEDDAQRLVRDGVVLKMDGTQQQVIGTIVDPKHLLKMRFKDGRQLFFRPQGKDTAPLIKLFLNARLCRYFFFFRLLPIPSRRALLGRARDFRRAGAAGPA